MADVHDPLTRLYLGDGPVVSVYLDARSDLVDANARFEIRWKDVRRQLLADGAPTELLEAVDEAIGEEGHTGGATLAVFAAPGAVVTEALPDPPRSDRGVVGPVPAGGPVLDTRQRAIPHLTVMTDRTGADIVQAFGPDHAGTTTVEGDTANITRSAPGGWSQRRFQQRAENTWEHNAKEVADAVAHAADEIGARLVVVAGDVRAKAFLRDHLPARWTDEVVEADAGDADGLATEVVRQVATVAARDTRDLVEDLRGRNDTAVQGAAATFAALRAAAVDVLLVHDDPDDERTALVSQDPAANALDGAELDGLSPRPARLVDAAIRGALATGARVRIVPAHVVDEGIGAVLRYPLRS